MIPDDSFAFIASLVRAEWRLDLKLWRALIGEGGGGSSGGKFS